MKKKLRLMIVAGEASGDAHAATLVAALREEAPEISFEFFGSTGALMRAEGVETVVNSDELAIMGLYEVVRVLPKFWRAFQSLKRAAVDRKPDAVVLVDWPDFNLRLARALHRCGIKVIYYISPQLWAWRSYRLQSIRRNVDLLLCILPFEHEWYGARGFRHAEFVGHPLAGEVRPRYERAEFCQRHRLDSTQPVVALLPGSRLKELERILPPMLDAASILSKKVPPAQFVIALAPNRSITEADAIIKAALERDTRLPDMLVITQHETREALAAADAAAVASGTATLEAALTQTPMVVVYKESPMNWYTLGRLINTKHYGLVNLIAGRRLATELMQNEFNGQRLASELAALLDQERNQDVRAQLRAVAAQLGTGGASRRAASKILNAILVWRRAVSNRINRLQ